MGCASFRVGFLGVLGYNSLGFNLGSFGLEGSGYPQVRRNLFTNSADVEG